ncbi:MAG: hypothetical protein QOF90_3372, partial [Acetobacteraceae bacterium]|nr:hypothetical protein [Acetobacteraceae bacterium]
LISFANSAVSALAWFYPLGRSTGVAGIEV